MWISGGFFYKISILIKIHKYTKLEGGQRGGHRLVEHETQSTEYSKLRLDCFLTYAYKGGVVVGPRNRRRDSHGFKFGAEGCVGDWITSMVPAGWALDLQC